MKWLMVEVYGSGGAQYGGAGIWPVTIGRGDRVGGGGLLHAIQSSINHNLCTLLQKYDSELVPWAGGGIP